MSESGFSKEQQAVTVPFFLHENEMTRMERVNKRLWIALLVIFVALIGTNAGWAVTLERWDGVQIARKSSGAFPDMTPQPEAEPEPEIGTEE